MYLCIVQKLLLILDPERGGLGRPLLRRDGLVRDLRADLGVSCRVTDYIAATKALCSIGPGSDMSPAGEPGQCCLPQRRCWMVFGGPSMITRMLALAALPATTRKSLRSLLVTRSARRLAARCARGLTSLLAEYFQIEYVTAPMPAIQIAVLAFQFEGRDHHPPGCQLRCPSLASKRRTHRSATRLP